MIHEKAQHLSEAMARRGVFEAEDIPVYAYGFELMISTAVNILTVIAVSLVFGAPLAWIFFLLPFIPLRLTAGGYHANSHLGCCITFGVAYALLLLPAVYLTSFMTPALLTAVSAAGLLAVLLLSPLPASAKPLDGKKKALNRRRSLLIAAAALLLTAVSFFSPPALLRLFVYFTLGQAGAAISLVAAKIVHKKGE
jgi:accessory gene regulator B